MTGVRDFLEEIRIDLLLPLPNRGYNSDDLMEGLIVGVVLRATRPLHAGAPRNDQVIKNIFGWNKGEWPDRALSADFSTNLP